MFMTKVEPWKRAVLWAHFTEVAHSLSKLDTSLSQPSPRSLSLVIKTIYLQFSLQQLSHILLQFAESHTSSKWWAMRTRRHLKEQRAKRDCRTYMYTPASSIMKVAKRRSLGQLLSQNKHEELSRKTQKTNTATQYLFPVSYTNGSN